MEPLDDGYERVFTVTEYYDGPRAGIAMFRDRPHLYHCERHAGADTYTDTFMVSPVPPDVFVLALEAWEIWLRWEAAFHSGRVAQETHPALPTDRARHQHLTQELSSNLVVDPETALRARGDFKPIAPALSEERRRGMVALQVRWSPVHAG